MDQLQQIIIVKSTAHVHIHPGQEGFACRGGTIIGDAMSNKLCHRSPVAIDDAPETPLFAKNLFESERISRRGNSVDGVEGAHKRERSSIHGRTERGQVELPQRMLGNFDRIILTAAFRRSITNIMFCTGSDTVRRIEPRALIAFYR